MASLQRIYWDTGITITEFADISQHDSKLVKDRLKELVSMYEANPDKLDKLVKEIAK